MLKSERPKSGVLKRGFRFVTRHQDWLFKNIMAQAMGSVRKRVVLGIRVDRKWTFRLTGDDVLGGKWLCVDLNFIFTDFPASGWQLLLGL